MRRWIFLAALAGCGGGASEPTLDAAVAFDAAVAVDAAIAADAAVAVDAAIAADAGALSDGSVLVDGSVLADGGMVDAGTGDGGTESDAATSDAGPVPSRCEVTEAFADCPHETERLRVGLVGRDVHYQLPLGEAPEAGWPVVFLFQGSYLPAGETWDAARDAAFGVYNQVRLVKALLDAGYAVLAPEASGEGSTYWNTNVPPYSVAWSTAPDHDFMLAMFAAIEDGTFGPIDAERYYATGISSGGYMSSRMAVSYRGRFRALAIHSASYATCGGATCFVPSSLPADHPPTLFLHGRADAIVPISTMERYRDRMVSEGLESDVVRDDTAGHRWLEVAPERILSFFETH